MGITHEWNGTVLTITSDSGTSSMDLKGEKGDTGVRGAQGIQGNAGVGGGGGGLSYPVGSLYWSDNNTNPEEYLGGTWQLVDKEFIRSSEIITPIQDYGKVMLMNDMVCIHRKDSLIITFDAMFMDSDLNGDILKIDLEALGVNTTASFDSSYFSTVFLNENVGAMGKAYLETNGDISVGVIGGMNAIVTIELTVPLLPNQMKDEFCDKFCWKRTAL